MAKTNFLTTEDATLILACRRGDSEAWAALIARYQKLIYAIPRRAGLDEDQCADIFQQTFQTLFEHLDRIDQPERVRAWLVTTAKRATERLQQRNARWQALPESNEAEGDETPQQEWLDPAPLPEEVITQLEDQHLVRTGVAALEERCRRLLTMLFYDPQQLPYAEIAAQIGIPTGSIGPTRNRCLQKLRSLLQEIGFSCIFLAFACSVSLGA
jgi:RNA polymerase sigma factor (sigma-70 family)